MNLKLTIEYDGTDYCGWQAQPNSAAIQDVIEQGLEKILGAKIRLIASGRTDAGVHALGQVANFFYEGEIDLWRLRVFSVRAMAKVEEHPSALRQDDLRRVAVSYGIENHSVCFGHRFSPSLLALFSFSEPDERAGMATLTRILDYLIL